MQRRQREAPVDPDDAGAALDTALRILNGAGQSAQGLGRRLAQRGYAPEAVEAVLERCRELGYVDDAALAESLAGRLQRSGHGRARVAAELRARGVGRDDAAGALDALAAGEDELALSVGRRLLERELRRGDDADPRRRVAGALARRGFSGSVVAGTLRRLSEERAGR